MRRFTEVLFLVACLLLPSFFVNGLQPLQATSKFRPTIKRNAVIRGLLVLRQSACPSGYNVCESIGCCPIGSPCCSDGNCCDPTFYCVLASNGIIGCCPIGETCSGPADGPTTINIPPPPPTGLPPSTPTINPPPPTQTINTSPPLHTTVNSSPIFSISTTTPISIVTSAPTTVLTQNPVSTGTGLPALSAAVHAGLYRPLLVLAIGILLAVMC